MDITILLEGERVQHLSHVLLTWMRGFRCAHTLVGIDSPVDAINHVAGRLAWPMITDVVEFERDIVVRSIRESVSHAPNSAVRDLLQIPRKPDGRVETKAELAKNLVFGQKDLADKDRIPVTCIVMRQSFFLEW